MTDRLTGVPGLVVEPAPPLFPDHPDACFVIHTASNRRLPATWVNTAAAQQFVAAARDMADWTDANVTGTAALAQAIEEHDGMWDVYGVPRLPTPPYVPTPTEIADLLAQALDVITVNGWCQGEAFDTDDYDADQEDEEGLAPDQCRVGARGAIHVAAEGHPRPPEAYESSVLASAATAALAETLGVADVTVWNDATGRTVDELHAAVTRTVDRLRDGSLSMRTQATNVNIHVADQEVAMASWYEITPRGQEIKAPDPGPVNPAGVAPGTWGRSGKRPPDNPAGASRPRRLRKPKAS